MRHSLPTVLPLSHNDTIKSLMDGFYPHLYRFAHGRLKNINNSVMDADDAVSSAFLAFWQGVSEGRFTITCDAEVYCLLKQITSRRCQDIIKSLLHSRRKDGRIVTESMDAATADGILGCDPDPSETLCAADMLSYTLSRLDDLNRKIITFRLEGCDYQTIAKYLDVCEQTIVRRMADIRETINLIRYP